ncbi:hypothetical protein C0J52_09372 [Blattella germanica]|nr:hypothetical protein C0J52_09372 [Blattella germanica]
MHNPMTGAKQVEVTNCTTGRGGGMRNSCDREIIGSKTVHRRAGQCRPRATTARDDRYLLLTARRNSQHNATQLRNTLQTATGPRVSTQTARNRLHGSGLYDRRPMVCTRLTPQHRRDRRNWEEENRGWRHAEWRSVLFSDESRFNVESDSRVRVLFDELLPNRAEIRYGFGAIMCSSNTGRIVELAMDSNFISNVYLTLDLKFERKMLQVGNFTRCVTPTEVKSSVTCYEPFQVLLNK